jgi:hypothetical protein
VVTADDGTGGPGADFLDSGPERPRPRPPRWSRWLLVPVAGVVAAVGIAQASRTDPPPPRTPAATAPATTPPTTSPYDPPASVGPPVVTTLGHPLLRVTAGWELFGRGDNEVVRIEPARGRITRTPVPSLLSGAPVFFVVGWDRALVRSLDQVPAYVVPDGQPARKVPVSGSGWGGPAFPGPDPSLLWAEAGDGGRSVMVLLGPDGRTRASIPVPEADSAVEVVPDGAGYLIFRVTGGVYDATPAGLRRITTGALLAVGPTRWLTLECDNAHRCRPYAVDRATGSRRPVPAVLGGNAPRGLIAPDGRTAVLFRLRPDGTSMPYLLDLASGATRPIGLAIGQAPGDGDGTVVWSPDSRWLFATGGDGLIRAVDPATAAITPLGVSVTALSQLAVRPAR